jgi:hypothetical protein
MSTITSSLAIDAMTCDRIGRAGLGVDLAEVELAREARRRSGLGQSIEIVRAAPARQSQIPGRRAAVDDRARLARGFFEVLDRDLVRVGVAGPRSRRARPAPGSRRQAFLTRLPREPVFVDAVLEVDIGVVDLPDEVAAEDALHEIGRDAELSKKLGRVRARSVIGGSASRPS